jgi:hypothetical protein
MRRVLLRLLPTVGAIAVTVPAAFAVSRQETTASARLPDLDQEAPSRLVITREPASAGTRWRLGFRSAVRNVGEGPLIIDGDRPSFAERMMRADQVIERDGAPLAVLRGVGRLRYVHSPDHQHWHLLGFERYELRRPGSTRALVHDRKTGFCLGDRYDARPPVSGRPPAPVYTGRCGLERPALLGIREGISVGYGDDYSATLEGQWLGLDGLLPGRYVLVHEVNAGQALRERSYANNAASLLLRLRWTSGRPSVRVLRTCPATPHCAARR